MVLRFDDKMITSKQKIEDDEGNIIRWDNQTLHFMSFHIYFFNIKYHFYLFIYFLMVALSPTKSNMTYTKYFKYLITKIF